MDSITQAALGATVAFAVSGKRLGRKSLLLGAALGTLPDLDVLFPHEDAIDNFTYHRSWSHSLIVLTVITPFVAWLARQVLRLSATPIPGMRHMILMVWLVLFTHPILDSFTVYGTQVLWPLDNRPVGIGNIFIIDPFYTVPLLAAIVTCFMMGRTANSHASLSNPVPSFGRGRRWAVGALVVSTLYLLLTLWVQQVVHQRAQRALNSHAFTYDSMVALPTPGSLLWRIVAKNDDEYVEGFHSLLHGDRDIGFQHYPSGEQLLVPLYDYDKVARLRWFTRGLYTTGWLEDELVMSDLRMGVETQYVFRFSVAEKHDGGDGQPSPIVPTRLLRFSPDIERIRELLKFMFDPEYVLPENP